MDDTVGTDQKTKLFSKNELARDIAPSTILKRFCEIPGACAMDHQNDLNISQKLLNERYRTCSTFSEATVHLELARRRYSWQLKGMWRGESCLALSCFLWVFSLTKDYLYQCLSTVLMAGDSLRLDRLLLSATGDDVTWKSVTAHLLQEYVIEEL